jgi:hypothetical protein
VNQAQGRRPLAITAEIKNFLARPGDLLKMHEKVPTNLPQPSLPHTPGIKLFRQLNSVFASVQLDYAEGQRSRAALHQLFGDHVTSLREVLLPYSLDRPQTLP